MAAPVVESFTSFGMTDDASSITGDKPTGLAEGEHLVAFIGADENPTISAPDGTWTQIDQQASSGSKGAWFWKEAGASEGSTYTFGFSSSQKGQIILIRISGADTTDFVNASGFTVVDTGDSLDVVCPSVITTVDDCLILRGWNSDGVVADNLSYGTLTEIATVSGGGSQSADSGVGYETTAAGATGTAAISVADGFNDHVDWTIAIAPASGAAARAALGGPGLNQIEFGGLHGIEGGI